MARIAIVSASLSTSSSTTLLATQIKTALQEAEGDIEFFDLNLRDLAKDITNNMLIGFPTGVLYEKLEELYSADAVVMLTPIYNTSYSGLFKMFIDILDMDLVREKPVLLGATGGTSRHSLALDYTLRPLFAHLRMPAVPTGVFASSEDWGSKDDEDSPLSSRIQQASKELLELISRKS